LDQKTGSPANHSVSATKSEWGIANTHQSQAGRQGCVSGLVKTEFSGPYCTGPSSGPTAVSFTDSGMARQRLARVGKVKDVEGISKHDMPGQLALQRVGGKRGKRGLKESGRARDVDRPWELQLGYYRNYQRRMQSVQQANDRGKESFDSRGLWGLTWPDTMARETAMPAMASLRYSRDVLPPTPQARVQSGQLAGASSQATVRSTSVT
jgi:hypothetical protein